MDLKNLTIKEARKLLDSKGLSAVDLAEYYLANIKEKNKELNVYLEVYDDVLEQAERAQKMIDNGIAEAMTGIPLALKDNILIKGKTASAASKILENYKATYTATTVQKLIDQGAVFLGRANMDEFACGGSTENSAFGVTKNPHSLERVAGGSSGGSAAAVAADMALGSLGSDTGGSVREPASFCGIVGLKPTYGAVSRYGLMAMGSSLDVIGPMAKTVEDTQIIFDSVRGKDKMDATSIDIEGGEAKIEGRKIRVGVPYHLINQEGITPEVKKNFEESVEKLKSLGFEIKDINLPNVDKSLAVYYVVMPAEVSSNLGRFDGIRYGLSKEGDSLTGELLDVYRKTRGYGFGPEVRRRIILGTYVLSAGYYDSYYGKALAVRRVIKKEFKEAFGQVDVILTPTTPTPAWKVGEKTSPLQNYLADIFTVSANIAGVPAISIPSGLTSQNLPLGIQFISQHGNDNILFEVGKKFLNEN